MEPNKRTPQFVGQAGQSGVDAPEDERTAQRTQERAEDAILVDRVRSSDPDAFGLLYDRWFVRVHDLAFRITRDEAAAADVAQDAFLRAWQNLATLEDPLAFGGWLLRIARNRALDRQRREKRSLVVDDEGFTMIETTGAGSALAPAGFSAEERLGAVANPAQIAEDNELSALLWESARALPERDQEVLDLGLRHEMSPADIGEVVGLSRNAANQAVHRARGRLKEAVEARVLWHRGKPKCSELTSELKDAGIEDFDALALACIGSHVTDCKKCQGRRALQLDPSKMFAAVPFLGVAWALRAQTAHALSNAGVPMGKSVGLAPRDPDRPRRFSSRRASKFIGAGLAVVVVLTGLVFSGEVGDGRLFEGESSPQVTPSTVVATIPGLVPEVTVTTRARGLAPAPMETGTASISISPGSAICCSFVSPTITWSSSGGARVEVLGANLSSSFPSGSTEICPGSTATGKCVVAGPSSFVYRVTVYGTSDQVLAESTVVFSVS